MAGKFQLADHIQKSQPPQTRDIETITAEILNAKHRAGESILAIGKGLIEAKALLSHGEWLPWLEGRVEFSEASAQRYMMLAREYSNPATLRDLGYSKALVLLALPEKSRDEFIEAPHVVNGEEKTVADMSVRELKAAIKERDEALKAAEQAKAEQKAADEAREKLSADMKLANERIAELNDRVEWYSAEAREAQDASARLEQELQALKDRPVEVAVEADPAAIEAAQKEAEERMQVQVDAAKRAQAEAEEGKKAAEDARAKAQQELDRVQAEAKAAQAQAEAAAKKAVLTANEDFVIFKTIFEQVQADGNKLCGLVMKARNKDQKLAEGFSSAFLDWLDKMRKAVAQ